MTCSTCLIILFVLYSLKTISKNVVVRVEKVETFYGFLSSLTFEIARPFLNSDLKFFGKSRTFSSLNNVF